MGVVERNFSILISSERMDTARYATIPTSVGLLTSLYCVGAAAFIAAAAKHLPPSDVWCILYPSLKHFLRSDVRDADEQSLLLALKHPVRLLHRRRR